MIPQPGESTNAYMKRAEDEYEKETNIFCPYCDQKQSEEVISEHTTYQGEPHRENDELQDCEECGKEFKVKESVHRTFETEKVEVEVMHRQKPCALVGTSLCGKGGGIVTVSDEPEITCEGCKKIIGDMNE